MVRDELIRAVGVRLFKCKRFCPKSGSMFKHGKKGKKIMIFSFDLCQTLLNLALQQTSII